MASKLSMEEPFVSAVDTGPLRVVDYLSLPEEDRRELIRGRYHVSPSPSTLHQIVVHLLGEALWRVARRTGGVVLVAPVDIVLAEHSVVQPDVVYIASGRREIVKEKVDGPPDLVVEVLSPQGGWRDRVEKLRLYAEAGVKEYWIADPVQRTFDFLVNVGGRYQVSLPVGGSYRSERLPEIEISLSDFWGEVDLRAPWRG
jgi:Uma2 family endonuclease